MSPGGQLPWRNRQRSTFELPRRGNTGRLAVMAAILVGLAAGTWLIFARLCSDNCTRGYCATTLAVEPPAGFAYASDVYEYRGAPPDVPAGGAIEIAVGLKGDVTNPGSLHFYRYISDASAWEPVTPATLDQSGTRAQGSFTSVPSPMVVMERVAPTRAVIAYLKPGEHLHPQAQGRVTTVLVHGLQPTGDGGITGSAPRPDVPAGVVYYPILGAGQDVDGSLAAVDAILSAPESRTVHVRQVVNYVTSNNLDGIHISYSDLRADQRLSFALFVQELGIQLRKVGKGLSLTLPAPVRTPERVDTGAYDWQMLGAAADFINISPIRDQSTYRTDLPVMLEYLKTVVDARKLNLTVTPYAAERGVDVRALTLTEAMGIATRIGVDGTDPEANTNVQVVGINIDSSEGLTGLLWDATTATVAFTYKDNGGRTVWLENSFSVGFKLEFVTSFGLGGFAVEDASDNAFLGDIWAGIAPFVDSGAPVLKRPNPANLEARWRVSGGRLEGIAKGLVRWTTPSEPGSYTINLTLSDGVAFYDAQVTVPVKARQLPTPAGR